MQNPRSRVIGSETNGDVVVSISEADDISLNRVGVVIGGASSAANHAKCVL